MPAPFGGPPTNYFASTTLANLSALYTIPTYGIPLDGRFVSPNPYQTYLQLSDPITGQVAQPKDTNLDYGFTGTIDWDLVPDVLHVRSITAYESYSGYDGYSNTPLPIATVLSVQTTSHAQVSQELDLTGTSEVLGNKLEWTLGGYYLDSENFNGGYVDFADNISMGFPPQFQPYAFTIADDASDSTKAGFAHIIYHITDDLSFEGGYRYSQEDRAYTFNHDYFFVTVPEAPLVNPGTTGNFSFGRRRRPRRHRLPADPRHDGLCLDLDGVQGRRPQSPAVQRRAGICLQPGGSDRIRGSA